MAGIQAGGVGSGLDINGLVTQLMANERSQLQSRVTRQQTSVVTEISALGQLKGAMGAFQQALGSLRTSDAFSTRTATSSDVEIFTASANTTAASGSYDIEVVGLATAHQISSTPFVGGANSEVGTGSLTIASGGVSKSIEIKDGKSSLADIRDAINAAAAETGVRATIVTEEEGSHLVLSAAKTGAANAIRVTQSGGNGALAALVYDPPTTPGSYETLKGAKDAEVRVATYTVRSPTNTLTGAIDGVTINLVKAEEGKTLRLDVGYDFAVAEDRVRKFVDSYNALTKQLGTLGAYDATTGKGGPLIGDALLRDVQASTRRGLTDPVSGLSGEYQTLASIGVTTSKDGTLTLDADKLQAALKADYAAVGKLFGSADGVGARLHKSMEQRLAVSADLATRNKTLDKRSKDLQKEQQAIELRLAKIEERYRKQFGALDGLLASMQSTSAYLSQQLASIAKIGQ